MKFIKIYGERNTGTTYLTGLIRRNIVCKVVKSRPPFWLRKIHKLIPNNNEILRDLYFSIRKNNLGWKHAFVNEKLFEPIQRNQNDFLILTLTKNPYSWLLSMYRRPYHSSNNLKIHGTEQTFEDFLSHEWTCLKRENSPKILLQNPIELWNLKNDAYLKLSNKTNYKAINIKYENVLIDHKKVLKELAKTANLKFVKSEIENVFKSAIGDASNFSDYNKFYLNDEWIEQISDYQFEMINRHLNISMMKKYEYKLINN